MRLIRPWIGQGADPDARGAGGPWAENVGGMGVGVIRRGMPVEGGGGVHAVR